MLVSTSISIEAESEADESTGAEPCDLVLTGWVCANGYSSDLNDNRYDFAGYTADGRPYYEGSSSGQSSASYLYYDAACSPLSEGYTMPPSWIFGCAQPSETATSDLTGFGAANGGCCNDANWASSAMQLRS